MKTSLGFCIWSVIFYLFFNFSCFGAEPYTLDRIVVRTNRDTLRADSLRDNYSVETFTASDIKEKNLENLTDLLDDVCGTDLRYRGRFGIQGDISLRGSTYEQVAVLIDGINLMDPQTGHYNLDIPLTIFDIEKVEIVKEGISSLYGAGAAAGSVNIIIKKTAKKALNLDTLFGEHALFGETFSFSFPQENLSSRISFGHGKSKAARPNTDFEYKIASLYLNKDLDGAALDALFGYQKKDFGADSFYSNLFTEEEEHTEAIFIRTGLDCKLGTGSLKNNLFFRKHRDKFILRRNNPTSPNYHTNYVYGLDSSFSLPVDWGDLLFGIDTGRDEISSSNLGKHTRFHEACSFGFIPEWQDKLTTDFRLRLDYYQKWETQESFNFGLGYNCLDDKLKIKGSFAHAFRIPSFTELYYSDSANKGNADLKAEKTDSFSLSLNFLPGFIDLGIEGFYRRGRNLIDWTRTSSDSLWQATSLGRVDFRGIEFTSKLKPDLNFGGLHLGKVIFSYSYTSAEQKASGFFSKYALDILKHQFILNIYSACFGLNFNWQLSYNQRYYGETYFVGNIYLSKKFTKGNFSLEPFIKIDNFSNAKYSEVAGVLQPERWIKSGLKFEW